MPNLALSAISPTDPSFANTTSFSSRTISVSSGEITSSKSINKSCPSCVIAADVHVLHQIVWFTETWNAMLDTEHVTVTFFNGSNATAVTNIRTVLGDVTALNVTDYPYSSLLDSAFDRANSYLETVPTFVRGTDGSVGTTSFPYPQAYAEVTGIDYRYILPNQAFLGTCLINTWFPGAVPKDGITSTMYKLDRTYYQPLSWSQMNQDLITDAHIDNPVRPWDGESFSAWLAEDKAFESVLPNWRDCTSWNMAGGIPAVKIPVAALTTTIKTTVHSAVPTSSPTAKPADPLITPTAKPTAQPSTGQMSSSSGGGSTGSESSGSGVSGTDSTGSQDGDESTGDSGLAVIVGSTGDTGSKTSGESSGDSGNAGSPTSVGSAGSQSDGSSTGDSGNPGVTGSGDSYGSQDSSGSSGNSANTGSPGLNGVTGPQDDPVSSRQSGNTGDNVSGLENGGQGVEITAGGSSGGVNGPGTQAGGGTGSVTNPTAPFVAKTSGHAVSDTLLGSMPAGSSPTSAGGAFMPIHPGASSIAVNGESQPLLTATTAPAPAPIATVGGQVMTASPGASEVYFASTTLSQNGPHVTISGQDIYVGSSGLVIGGSSTIILPTGLAEDPSSGIKASAVSFTAAGHTFTSSPSGIAVADTTISLGSTAVISGTVMSYGPMGLVIGTSTIPITTPHTSSANTESGPAHVFTLGGQTFTRNATAVAISGTTLTPGSPALTISGTAISLGSSSIVIASSVYAIPSSALFSSTTVINGETFIINPTAIEVGGTTLTPGSSALTISGTAISLGSSGIVIASSTYAIPSNALLPSPTVIGGETFTINPTAIEVGGTTLSEGGSATTVNGTVVSLGPSGLVVAGSTLPHHNDPSTVASTTSEGLGAIILAGFGPSSTSTGGITPTETLNGTGASVAFQGNEPGEPGRGRKQSCSPSKQYSDLSPGEAVLRSLTFGSVGDVITLCIIIKDLVKALDESRGASSEYQEIIRELWALDRLLLEIELLWRTSEETIELNALRVTAHRIVDQCRYSIENFLGKIQKHDKSLREGGSRNHTRDAASKIHWQVVQSSGLTKFRAEINAHCSAISMLLVTASVNQAQIFDKKREKESHDHASVLKKQGSVLDDVRNQLLEVVKHTDSTSGTTTKILEALKLDWLRQLGQEMKGFMRKIFMTNVAIYQAVLDIRGRLPSHMERCLDQEPFILEDGIGRIAPVHMQFISSWEAFDSVLELRFRGMQGYKLVQNKRYVMQEQTTKREIDRTRNWECSFLPGQKVVMSMLFDDATGFKATCPRCQTPTEKPLDSDIQCASCAMWYRRIVEYNDIDPLKRMTELPSRNSKRAPVQFGESPFKAVVFGPEEPTGFKSGMSSQKRQREDASTDELTMFKRVRILSRKTRLKRARNDSPFSRYVKVNALAENKILRNSKGSVEKTGFSSNTHPASFDTPVSFASPTKLDSRTPNDPNDSDSSNDSDGSNDSGVLDRLEESNGLVEHSNGLIEQPNGLVESEASIESKKLIEAAELNESDHLTGQDVDNELKAPIKTRSRIKCREWSAPPAPMTWTESQGWVPRKKSTFLTGERDVDDKEFPTEHQIYPQAADTILLKAAADGDREAVTAFLSSVLEKGEWMSPESVATVSEGFERLIKGSHIELVELFISKVPHFLVDKAYVSRSIRIAAESSQIYILYKILRHELEYAEHPKGSTPLHLAARLGQAAAVRLLLQHGVNTHSVDMNCETPLQVAQAYGYHFVVRMLEEAEQERAESERSWDILPKHPYMEASEARSVMQDRAKEPSKGTIAEVPSNA